MDARLFEMLLGVNNTDARERAAYDVRLRRGGDVGAAAMRAQPPGR
jgi:hypothetical protein